MTINKGQYDIPNGFKTLPQKLVFKSILHKTKDLFLKNDVSTTDA